MIFRGKGFCGERRGFEEEGNGRVRLILPLEKKRGDEVK